jgi:HSP20 family protein
MFFDTDFPSSFYRPPRQSYFGSSPLRYLMRDFDRSFVPGLFLLNDDDDWSSDDKGQQQRQQQQQQPQQQSQKQLGSGNIPLQRQGKKDQTACKCSGSTVCTCPSTCSSCSSSCSELAQGKKEQTDQMACKCSGSETCSCPTSCTNCSDSCTDKTRMCQCSGSEVCFCSDNCTCGAAGCSKKGSQFRSITTWRPHSDVTETENSFIIHCDLPGVKKEHIKLDVNNGMLRMSATLDKEKRKDTNKYHRVERRYGKFERVFPLQQGVDPASINATCKEGVLTIEIPKVQEKAPETRAIDIA